MPCSDAAGGRHLAFRVLEVAHARPHLRDARLGHHEQLTEPLVEALGDVAHQLQVLALVLPHRDLVGTVGEHVGGLQHGVVEEPGGRQLALPGRLVAELVHAVELADRRDGGEQPGELGVLLDVALAEQDAAVRVQPRGHQDRGRVVHPLAQPGRVVRDGDRVQVDDAVDRQVGAVLPGDVVQDRADVVPEVLGPRGLDAGEDDHGSGIVIEGLHDLANAGERHTVSDPRHGHDRAR